MENGTTALTIMAVNAKTGRPQSGNCIFQPELRVDSEDNEFSFAKYSGSLNFDLLAEEEQSLELQYRNKHVYGTGLGTAVNWKIDENGILQSSMREFRYVPYFKDILTRSVFPLTKNVIPKEDGMF